MNRTARANRITEDLLRPLLHTTWKFYAAVTILGALVLMGLLTWLYQMMNGLAVTGDNWPVFWSFHETNFEIGRAHV